jgi:hypothetical protein
MTTVSRRALLSLGLTLLLTTGMPLCATAQIQFEPKGLVITQGGVGAVQISLTGVAPKLDLKYGPFIDKVSHATLTAPKIVFALATGGDASGQTVSAADKLELQAKITDFTGSTDAEVPIFNGSTLLGTIEVVALDAPLNVSIDGDGASPDKPLAFMRGQQAYILVKNADAEAYKFHWHLQAAHTNYDGDATLPPHGSARIAVTPYCHLLCMDCSLFSWADWVHPSALKGSLQLHMIGSDKVEKELLPVQRIAVNLSLMGASSSTTTLLSYGYAAVNLIVGGPALHSGKLGSSQHAAESRSPRSAQRPRRPHQQREHARRFLPPRPVAFGTQEY